MSDFLHGVEMLELNGGARPIRSVKSSVIGLVGTAPMGSINKPTLIAGSRKEAVMQFGQVCEGYSIPSALDAIFDQVGATVVVINVFDPTNPDQLKDVDIKEYTFDSDDRVQLEHCYPIELVVTDDAGIVIYNFGEDYTLEQHTGQLTRLNSAMEDKVKIGYKIPSVSAGSIQGGVNATTGDYEGIQALLSAESITGATPRLLIAPGFSDNKDIVDDLLSKAESLRAVVIADGPNTNDEDAKTYRENFDNSRLYLIDPAVIVTGAKGEEVIEAASARVAGVIAKSDNERGFWWSPSNQPILGINGTARSVDFALGDSNARANLLNEKDIATIIRQSGYRLWGNHSCSTDPKWQFISVRRTADLINDALLRAHLWAVDRNITKTYVNDVIESVNGYLRHLTSIGAILGGKCWADPELNTPDQVAQGNVYFDFDFTPPYPAEHITFRSQMTNNYLEEIFA